MAPPRDRAWPARKDQPPRMHVRPSLASRILRDRRPAAAVALATARARTDQARACPPHAGNRRLAREAAAIYPFESIAFQ